MADPLSNQHQKLKTILKKAGFSLTESRLIVFDLLLDQEAQSMQVLTKRAEGKADRATLYRTIELFERLGIVHRLNIGWKYKIELSEMFAGHHHHFYCTNCGRTYSLPESPMLETMINSVASKEGFSPRGHQLEIHGLCANCKKV